MSDVIRTLFGETLEVIACKKLLDVDTTKWLIVVWLLLKTIVGVVKFPYVNGISRFSCTECLGCKSKNFEEQSS